MTRLVLHAGTHHTDWWQTQRELVASRDALADCGVRLHPADSPARWLADVVRLTTGDQPKRLDTVIRTAVEEDAAAVLLSSERLEDPLRDAARVSALTSYAADLAMPLTVVLVVRDQLGYINDTYGDRVVRLQTARSFDSFVADPTPAPRFDYSTAFAALLDSSAVELVVLRHSELPTGGVAGALLGTVGAPLTALRTPPAPKREPALPGPLLITASRLLFRRLWRHGVVTPEGRTAVAKASRSLRAHAAAAGWDSERYWGWTDELAATAKATYGPGNDSFAAAVWGTAWGDDWSSGVVDSVDLASFDPPAVVDILDAVDAIVSALVADKQATVSD